MNRLPFGSFHAAHFSPQHVQQWHSYLQNLPIPPSDYYQQTQEPAIDNHEESRQSEPDVDDLPLSKEAMEIFEFSESYSKERRYFEKETANTDTIND
jgi:hypothetical protein